MSTATIQAGAKFAIVTATPEITIGQVMISADRRSTKEKPLTDEQRIRRVVLPAGCWGSLSATVDAAFSQPLLDVLSSGLRQLASDRLRDFLEEDPMMREVPAEAFALGSLLAWSAETAASRGAAFPYSREELEEWLPTSAAFKAAGAKALGLAQILASVASRTPKIPNAAVADALIVKLAGDAADPVGIALIGRITVLADRMRAKERELMESLGMDV